MNRRTFFKKAGLLGLVFSVFPFLKKKQERVIFSPYDHKLWEVYKTGAGKGHHFIGYTDDITKSPLRIYKP